MFPAVYIVFFVVGIGFEEVLDKVFSCKGIIKVLTVAEFTTGWLVISVQEASCLIAKII